MATEAGQYKVCDAAALSYESRDGWSLVESFVEAAVKIDESEGYGKERIEKIRYADRRMFVLFRPEGSALADMEKRLAEAEQKWGRAELARQKAEREIASATKAAEELRAALDLKTSEVDPLREQVRKMERHIGKAREVLGSERWAQIAAQADEEEIPF